MCAHFLPDFKLRQHCLSICRKRTRQITKRSTQNCRGEFVFARKNWRKESAKMIPAVSNFEVRLDLRQDVVRKLCVTRRFVVSVDKSAFVCRARELQKRVERDPSWSSISLETEEARILQSSRSMPEYRSGVMQLMALIRSGALCLFSSYSHCHIPALLRR